MAKQWVLIASQSAGAWFSPSEWSTSEIGKFAILDQIENFRLVRTVCWVSQKINQLWKKYCQESELFN